MGASPSLLHALISIHVSLTFPSPFPRPTQQIHHPLHLPTFLAQYNKFWSMSPSHRCSTVHSRWLALLYIILCLGDHFGDENMSTDDTLEGQLLVVSLPVHPYSSPSSLQPPTLRQGLNPALRHAKTV